MFTLIECAFSGALVVIPTGSNGAPPVWFADGVTGLGGDHVRDRQMT